MQGPHQAHSPSSDASGPRPGAEVPRHPSCKEVAAPASERSTLSGTSGISVIQLGLGPQEAAVAAVAPALVAGADAGSGAADYPREPREHTLQDSGAPNLTDSMKVEIDEVHQPVAAAAVALGATAGEANQPTSAAAAAPMPAPSPLRALAAAAEGRPDGDGVAGGRHGETVKPEPDFFSEDLHKLLAAAAAAVAANGAGHVGQAGASSLGGGGPMNGAAAAGTDDAAAATAAGGGPPVSAVVAAVAASRQVLKRPLPPSQDIGAGALALDANGTGSCSASQDPEYDPTVPEGRRGGPGSHRGGARGGQAGGAPVAAQAARGGSRAASGPIVAPSRGAGRGRRTSAAADADPGSDAGEGGGYGSQDDVPAPAVLPPPVEVTVAVRVAAGRAGEDEQRYGNGSYIRGSVSGFFDPSLYMARMDCIRCGGTLVSRSHFEKMGGSNMAKWYRSIRVLPTMEPLGEWLERHGLPVLKGAARRSRPRKPMVHPSVIVTGPASHTGMELSPVGSGGEASGGGGAACGSGGDGAGEPPAKRRAAAGSAEGCSSSCADGDEWIRPPGLQQGGAPGGGGAGGSRGPAASNGAAGAFGGMTSQAPPYQPQLKREQLDELQQQHQQAYELAGGSGGGPGGGIGGAAPGLTGLLGPLFGAVGQVSQLRQAVSRGPGRLNGGPAAAAAAAAAVRQYGQGEGSVSGSPAEPNDDEAEGTEALMSLSMMIPSGSAGPAAATGAAAAPIPSPARDVSKGVAPPQEPDEAVPSQRGSQRGYPQAQQRQAAVLSRVATDAAGPGADGLRGGALDGPAEAEGEGEGVSDAAFGAGSARGGRGRGPAARPFPTPGGSGSGGRDAGGAAVLRMGGPHAGAALRAAAGAAQDAGDPLAVARRALAREAAAVAAAAAAAAGLDGGPAGPAGPGPRVAAADGDGGVADEDYIPQPQRSRQPPPPQQQQQLRGGGDMDHEQEFELPVVQGPAAAVAAARRAAALGAYLGGAAEAEVMPQLYEYVRRAGVSQHNGAAAAAAAARGRLVASEAAALAVSGARSAGASEGPRRLPADAAGLGTGVGALRLPEDLDWDSVDDSQLQAQLHSVGAPTMLLSIELERVQLIQRVQQLERLKQRVQELEHLRAGLGPAVDRSGVRGAGSGPGAAMLGRSYTVLHRGAPGAVPGLVLEGRQNGGGGGGVGPEGGRERMAYGAAGPRGYGGDAYGGMYGRMAEEEDMDEGMDRAAGAAGRAAWGPALVAQERGFPGGPQGLGPLAARGGGGRPGADLHPAERYPERYVSERYGHRGVGPAVVRGGRDDGPQQMMDEEDDGGGYYWPEAVPVPVPVRGGMARQAWQHSLRDLPPGAAAAAAGAYSRALAEGGPGEGMGHVTVTRGGRAIPVHVHQDPYRQPYVRLHGQERWQLAVASPGADGGRMGPEAGDV